MINKKIVFLVIISLLLLPQLVLAKTKTVYLYEDSVNENNYNNIEMRPYISIGDYLLIHMYGEDLILFRNSVRDNGIHAGDKYTIRLKNGICDDYEPINGRAPASFIEQVESISGNNNVPKTDTVNAPSQEEKEFQQKMCNNFNKYIKQDYDEVIIEVLSGTEPKPELKINATSAENALQMNIASAQLLGVMCMSNIIENNLVEELQNSTSPRDELEILRNIQFKKDGKLLATANAYDFTLIVPDDVTTADNISVNSDKMLEIIENYLRKDGSDEETINRNMRAARDFIGNSNFTITFREQDKVIPSPTPIVNPKTFTNIVLIALISILSIIALALGLSKKKKTY